jgi:subtilase family serine protease
MRAKRNSFQLEALEPRVLLSASLVDVGGAERAVDASGEVAIDHSTLWFSGEAVEVSGELDNDFLDGPELLGTAVSDPALLKEWPEDAGPQSASSSELQPLNARLRAGTPSLQAPPEWQLGETINSDFPPLLAAQEPHGSLIFSGKLLGEQIWGTDANDYRITLEGGQTATILVTGFGDFQPIVELFGPNSALPALGRASAAAPGEKAVLPTVPIAEAGAYTIRLSGIAGSVGRFEIELLLNAAVESEELGLGDNNDPTTAQNLDASFLEIQPGAFRGAVLGNASATGQDWYAFHAELGERLTLVTTQNGGGSQVGLFDHFGHPLARGVSNVRGDVDELIQGFIVGATGTFYAAVTGSDSYSLLVQRNLAWDTEPNSRSQDAQSLIGNGGVLGNLGGAGDRRSSGGTIRVALLAAPGGTMTAGEQLADDTYFDFDPVLVSGWQIDTVSELSRFDVVVIGDYASHADLELIGPALKTWVESGGGVVGTGWLNYAASDYTGAPIQAINDIIPIDTDYYRGSIYSPSIQISGEAHSITNGVASFRPSAYLEYVVADPGSTVLATAGNTPAVVVSDVANGRAAYLGPVYSQNIYYQELRSGEADRLFEQAVAWAARGGLDSADEYRILVSAGDVVRLETSTPGGGFGLPDNDLDPLVELYDAVGTLVASNNNGGPDGRNAIVQYTSESSGLFRVRVSSVVGVGAYVLNVDGLNGNQFAPFAVESAVLLDPNSPGNGEALSSFPSALRVRFTSPILLTSLEAADLLGGGPGGQRFADGFNLVDGRTVDFDISSWRTSDGGYSLTLPANSIEGFSGTLNEASVRSFQLDTTLPYVTQSSVTEGQVLSPGSLTYSVVLSEPIDPSRLGAEDIRLTEVGFGTDFTGTAFSYDAGTRTIQVTFNGLYDGDYLLHLMGGDSAVRDLVGWGLNGAPSSPLPSGQGSNVVGDYELRFRVDPDGAAPYPGPLDRKEPLGSLIYDPFIRGGISTGDDLDVYTLVLDENQAVSAIVSGTGALVPKVELIGPGGAMDVGIASSSGSVALIQSHLIDGAGTYFLRVSGDAGSTGAYSLQVVLNAAIEEENLFGWDNGTTATAQSLATSFIDLGAGALRAAVNGKVNTDRDYYSVTLAAGEALSTVVKAIGSNKLTIWLEDASGALATGLPGATNLTQSITDFVSPSGGTYYIGVQGLQSGVGYNLVVLKNAFFELESNDSLASAQALDRSPNVLAYASGVDYFRFWVLPGDRLRVTTSIPGSGSGEPVNSVQLSLELLDPDGNVLAVGPSIEGYDVTEAAPALYAVRVTAESGEGAYVMHLRGAHGQSAFTVTGNQPLDSSASAVFPSSFSLTFSEAFLTTSVQATDLLVETPGGAVVTATEVVAVDAKTLRFSIGNALAEDGVYTVLLLEGGLTSVSAKSLSHFESHFTFDSHGPQVVHSSIAPGTSVGSGNVSLSLVLNEDLATSNLGAEDISLISGNTTINASSVAYDPATRTLEITFFNVAEGPYTLLVTSGSAAVRDLVGNALDGNGDGVAGDAFSLQFLVDTDLVPFGTPFVPYLSQGSLIYSRSRSGEFGFDGDTDRFALDLDGGQTVTILLRPTDPSVRAQLELFDGVGTRLRIAAGNEAGQSVLIQTVPIQTTGTYTFAATALHGSGGYELVLLLNALWESESSGASSNDTVEQAELLSPSALALGPIGADRMAVVGRTDSAEDATADYFAFSLEPNQHASIALTRQGSGQVDADLLDGAGFRLATGLADRNNVHRQIAGFKSASAGTYYVRVQGTAGAAYALVILRGADIDLEPNDEKAPQAQDVSGTGVVLGAMTGQVVTTETEPNGSVAQANDWSASFVSIGLDQYRASVTGTISAGSNSDWDYFKIHISQGDGLRLDLEGSPTGKGTLSDTYLYIANSAGTILVQDDDAGEGFNSLIGYQSFPYASGDYFVVADSFGSSTGSYTLTATITTPHILMSGGNDYYSIPVEVGDQLMIRTYTPAGGTGQFENDIDPRVELYDPFGITVDSDENSADDGRNAFLQYTASVAGSYTVRVSGATFQPGEYVLEIRGYTGSAPLFSAIGSAPVAGALLSSYPSNFVVHFSEPILLTSVEPSDLTIDGVPATAVTVVDADTLEFNITSGDTGDGLYEVILSDGAITSLSGKSLTAFRSTFDYDATNPRVVASSVTEGGVVPPGTLVYTVKFSEELDSAGLGVEDVSLNEALTGNSYSPSTFAYDPVTSTAAVTFSNLPEGNYTLTLLTSATAFRDRRGNLLDGSPSFPLPSGDGNPGDAFVVHFAVDRGSTGFPVPLVELPPAGALVYRGSVAGLLNGDGDLDAFTIELDAGQTLSLRLKPAFGSFQSKLEVLDQELSLRSTVAATGAGQTLTLDSMSIALPGTYVVQVRSLAGSGAFTLEALLNASFEAESIGGAGNNDISNAQDLRPAFFDLGDGASRAAILGSADGLGNSSDLYRIHLNTNELATFAVTSLEGKQVKLSLYDIQSAGAGVSIAQVVALGSRDWLNVDEAIAQFKAPATGTYFIRVEGAGEYTFVATRGIDLQLESYFEDFEGALGPEWSVSGTDGSVAAFSRFLGRFSSGPGASLTLRTVPGRAYSLDFDLMIIDSWDGDHPFYGPDFINVSIGGVRQFHYSFPGGGGGGTYPGGPSVSGQDFGWSGWSDSIYRNIHLAFTATSATTTIQFNDGGLQGLSDESWGIDNVRVRLVGAGAESADKAQDISFTRQVLGNFSGGFDEFQFSVADGDTVEILTSTPGDGVGEPLNTLDPSLELYTSSGLLVAFNDNGGTPGDGRNAVLAYTVPVGGAGVYRIRVLGSGRGDYRLWVQGANGAVGAGPRVVSTSPSLGASVLMPPEHLEFTFSEALRAGSLGTNDLTLDHGATVSRVELIDGRTVRYSISVPNEHLTFSYNLAAGMVQDLQGQPNEGYAGTFLVDKRGPRVMAQSPALQASAPFSQFRFVYNEPINPETFTVADVSQFQGPGGTDLRSQITGVIVEGNQATVTFHGQSSQGTYIMRVGPEIEDLVGNRSDQNDNGVEGEANDFYIGTVNLQAADLTVLSVQIPANGVLGRTVNLSWVVKNIGSDPAIEGWNDQIWFSTDEVLDAGDIALLATPLLPPTGTLPMSVNGAYAQNGTVTLPLTYGLSPGDYFLIVKADSGNEQPENNENNNTKASRISLSLPALPDLVVSSISAPAAGVSGQPVQFSWTVSNQGTADATGSWYDRVWLSPDNALGSDLYVGDFVFSGTIAAGQSITRTQFYSLPIALEDNRWFIVVTDSGNSVYEHGSEGNNTLVADVPTSVELSPLPNLQVTSVQSPPVAFSGQPSLIEWLVTNAGTGAVGVPSWYDRVWLSQDTVLDGGDTFLADVLRQSSLGPNESYTGSLTATIPAGLEGQFWFIVQTDALNVVFEKNHETDNYRAGASTQVQLTRSPDLQVGVITAADLAFPGQTVSVGWTVINSAPVGSGGTTLQTDWFDTLYLSSQSQIQGGNAIALLTRAHSGALDPGGSYTTSADVVIPGNFLGSYYFIVVTDAGNQVFEGGFDGNNANVRRNGSGQPSATHIVVAPSLELSSSQVDYLLGSAALILAPQAALSDVDTPIYEGGKLTVRIFQGGADDDRLMLVEGGAGADEVTLQNNRVIVGTHDVGTFVATDGVSGLLRVDFGPLTSVTDVLRVIRRVGFRHDGSPESASQRTIEFQVDDGHGLTSRPALMVVRVLPVNHPPQLTAPGSRQAQEGTLLTVQIQAQDPDAEQSVQFALEPGAPAGAVIDATTGLFSWEPSETQGPGLYRIVIRGTDTAANPLSATVSFTVQVNEVNQAPVLVVPVSVLSNQTTVQFVATATDADRPNQVLNFSLAPGGPEGASIDPLSGQFTWTPAPSVLDGEYLVTVRVVDNGSPAASDSRVITLRLDRSGPKVVSVVPSGIVSKPVSYLDVTFDTEINPSSIVPEALRLASAGVSVIPSSVTQLGERLYRFHFASAIGVGTYVVSISPTPRDLAGNALDQDGDRVSGEAVDDVYSTTIQVNLPDLVVSGVVAETPISVGEPFTVGWQLTNAGAGPASGDIRERVVLLADANGNPERVVGEVTFSGSLAPGATVARQVLVSLPGLPITHARFVVRADVNAAVIEAREDNNESSPSAAFEVRAPNLRLEGVSVASSGVFGQSFAVTWSVKNIGSNEAKAGWLDAVYFRRIGEVGLGLRLAAELRPLPNELGQSPGDYQRRIDVILPLGSAFQPGLYEIVVVTDATDEQIESTNDDNVKTSAPIQVSYPNLPDLTVTSVGGQPLTGQFAQPGELFNLQWSVGNAGTGLATGGWIDRAYLVPVGDTSARTLLYSAAHESSLVSGGSYSVSQQFVLPELANGDYRLRVEVDADGEVFEGVDNASNELLGESLVVVRHANLIPMSLSVPSEGTSYDTFDVSWRIETEAGLDVFRGWKDALYLSTDATKSSDDRLLGTAIWESGMTGGQSTPTRTLRVRLPVDSFGNLYVLLMTDAGEGIREGAGENDNTLAMPIAVSLRPYANLVPIELSATSQVIGDPGTLNVSWSIKNLGTGPGVNGDWEDVIALKNVRSPETPLRVLGRFAHTGLLDAEQGYSRTEQIVLPPALSDAFRVVVITDYQGTVFENGLESDNTREAGATTDIMPAPYSDLQVKNVSVLNEAFSGRDLRVAWRIENHGIGITDEGTWTDQVYLATDPSVPSTYTSLGSFVHFGLLGVGDGYDREVRVRLPNELSGDRYIVVRTGGPFEFTHTDNNKGASGIFEVRLSDSPDLVVAQIEIPGTAQEGAVIDISWRVANQGLATASGTWIDSLELRPADDSRAQGISLGTFEFSGTLNVGNWHDRRESIRLPAQVSNAYRLYVTTNASGTIYEGAARVNNTASSEGTIKVALLPRPDLEVFNVTAPTRVAAGGTLDVEFEVRNTGLIATTTPNWQDRVYLSLDDRVSSDDILVGSLVNGSALSAKGPGYHSSIKGVKVPERMRGQAFLLVFADAGGQVDEWPDESDNVEKFSIYVEPLPLADLVVHDVIAPAQATEGAAIQVGFTVTNRGSGDTRTSTWTDSIWLATDRNRPHPGKGDILLGTRVHNGALGRKAGYDYNPTGADAWTVTLPVGLDSGTYFIIPWTDPYDGVPEDTLVVNENPDDPNEFDNNNYKARAITIIGQRPDLVVEWTDVRTTGLGGTTLSFSYRVINRSSIPTRGSGWHDQIWLSDNANPTAPGAKSFLLEDFVHSQALEGDAVFTRNEVTLLLSPSAQGTFLVVTTDPTSGQPGDVGRIKEIDERNNTARTPVLVRPVPANLVVSKVYPIENAISGEVVTLRYDVKNVGENPVWSGTRYWKDFLWLSADPVFDRNRSTYLGEVVHAPDKAIQPNETYTVEFQARMPKGADGQYYLHIHLDAHNDLDPTWYPYDSRRLITNWWPADSGSNAGWVDEFRRWAYEDPRDNLTSQGFQIVFREADLVVNVAPNAWPVSAFSGDTVHLAWSVTNSGGRTTRESSWVDRVFLSRDASLDPLDLELGSVGHSGTLAVGKSYDAETTLTLPESINGAFYLIVYSDSAASRDPNGWSDIGINQRGITFSSSSLAPWDLASEASRKPARGAVPEYQFEGNNVLGSPLQITLRTPPDLRVDEVVSGSRDTIGQTLEFSYTVKNYGGDTRPGQSAWQDLYFLSRDEFLDVFVDRYIGGQSFSNGLKQGEALTPPPVVVDLPGDLAEGAYYLFVVTDPSRRGDIGQVFEGGLEFNNSRSRLPPILLDLPPPTDLRVTAIDVPDSSKPGELIQVSWNVSNASTENPVTGRWSDAVYLSADGVWDINDRLLGRTVISRTLAPGSTYTAHMSAKLPAVLPGNYRIIVRTDIYNQIPEAENESNNTSASGASFQATVDAVQLGVPYQTTLHAGQERLLSVSIGEGETLRARLESTQAGSVNELFLRYGDVPSGAVFDAAYTGAPGASVSAILPSTRPGIYYILLRSYSQPSGAGPASVTLFTEVLPLAITDVHTDVGGDSSNLSTDDRYVTTTIRGARFSESAIVKLVRPGFEEIEPLALRRVDATQLIAVFDFKGKDHGLYDLTVINPGGDSATVPYRFLVETGIESDVTIGIGGPRILMAGDVGLYSLALQNVGNLDAPYVVFKVGAPEMGINEWVYNLPYFEFFTNIGGRPPSDALGSVPWSALNSLINLSNSSQTSGHNIATGYLYDHPADGFTGVSFSVATYPGLREMADANFAKLRAALYGLRPDLAKLGLLDDGPNNLDLFLPGLQTVWNTLGGIPDDITKKFIPYQFDVLAAATTMTRAEFVEYAAKDAEKLRQAILNDDGAAGASFLTMSDLRGLSSMVEKLKLASDPVSAFLYGKLSASARQALAVYDPQSPDTALTQSALVRDLNLVLAGPSIYEAARFSAVTLRSSTLTLRDRAVSGEELVRLNRLLLEDAYASEIARNRASTALLTLAADSAMWRQLYLAALEDAGVLRPENGVPAARRDPLVVSSLAVLSAGILLGPAGQEYRTTGDLLEFFNQVRDWYGNKPGTEATSDPAIENPTLNPIPLIPNYSEFDLGLARQTYYQALRVYVPWVEWGQRGASLPADFQISGAWLTGTGVFKGLDLTEYFERPGTQTGTAAIVGPVTLDTNGFVPAEQALPFTVHFQNDPTSPTSVREIQIVTQLDPALDITSFRLGDMQIGEYPIDVPDNSGLFQRDYDLTNAKGYILRVSAGMDPIRREVIWRIQAIDPLTGEVVQDSSRGLLPPNDTLGTGAGFVSYTAKVRGDLSDGSELTASARVIFDSGLPAETSVARYPIDARAPVTVLKATRLDPTSNDYRVEWAVSEESGGSGFRHVTVFVSEGGSYRIWRRWVTLSQGVDVFEGQPGHTYKFLALATDLAGNREQPPFGVGKAEDGASVSLGPLPDVVSTHPDFGSAPPPASTPSTNPVFTEAEKAIPSAPPLIFKSEFEEILKPFLGEAFVTGLQGSGAGISALAMVETPNGEFLVAGGPSRNALYRVKNTGGSVAQPLASLAYPIYNLAFDSTGRLWATTGGGPLLELDSLTGAILAQHGDGLTMGLAVSPDGSRIFVGSGHGVEIFDPAKGTFTHYSRDEDLRITSLAFGPDGRLWAITWPDRREVIRFTDRARAEAMLEFDSDLDSLAFGLPGTKLEGLLFLTHNGGPKTPAGRLSENESPLTMVDLATLRRITVAHGGSRGDAVLATSDGRLLVSQSNQIDSLSVDRAPLVLATNPPDEGVAALPLTLLTVVFDQDILATSPGLPGSVLNPTNFELRGAALGVVPIRSISYDAKTRTAYLSVAGLLADTYDLVVRRTITNARGTAMLQPYEVSFNAISDFSAVLDIVFDSTRSNRADGTVSFDVRVTNRSVYDLKLPFLLALDPRVDRAAYPAGTTGRSADGRWYLDLSSTLPAGGILKRVRPPRAPRSPGPIRKGIALNLAPAFGRNRQIIWHRCSTAHRSRAPSLANPTLTRRSPMIRMGCRSSTFCSGGRLA